MKAFSLAVLSLDGRGKPFYLPRAELSVADGRILGVRARRGPPSRWLAIPGLIDAHAHICQYPAVAADGLELLPWLKRRIFPVEKRFRGERARALAKAFYEEMASEGTTTACLYAGVWRESAEACFEEALRSGLRVVLGKVMMDRGSYDGELKARRRGESRAALSLRESVGLCERWHGRQGRLFYAFTPRFALSCSPGLLSGAAREAARRGAYIQTHLAENRAELKAVRRAFPRERSYTEVYAGAGLLGPRTLLAHAIWLKAPEITALARSRSVAVHCPTSNAFLSSGTMDYAALARAGVPLALGSDVAAGPTLSLFSVMRQAIYAQRLARAHGALGGEFSLGPREAFYMATLGGARALGWGESLGSLEPGKSADFVVLDRSAYEPPGPLARFAPDVLARLVYRAGRHAVRAAFVEGRPVRGLEWESKPGL